MTLPEGGPLSWHEMMWRSGQLENKHALRRILILETALRQCLRIIENALLQATLVGVEDTEDDNELVTAEIAPFYCRTEWGFREGSVKEDCTAHSSGIHRCIHRAGHEREEPHYCRCGAEL